MARARTMRRSMTVPATVRSRWITRSAVALAAIPLVWSRVADAPLGVPHPPFVGSIDPHADPLIVVSLLCFAVAVAIAPRLLAVGRPTTFAAGAFAVTLVLRLALAAGGGGRGGAGIAAWWKVFDPARSYEAPNEYLPALGALHWGPRFFLDRFAETVPALPVHAAGHPPGLLLTLDALGIASRRDGSAVHRLGRAERPARVSARPRGARRAARPARGAAPGVRARRAVVRRHVGRRRLPDPRAAGRMAAGRAVVARAGGGRRRARRRVAVRVVAAGGWGVGRDRRAAARGMAGRAPGVALCGGALVAFYALLYGATGFDPVGTLRATEDVYRAGIASARPYSYWLLGSPAAFLLVLGLPISWYALRALAAGRTLAIAIFAVLAFAAVMGFTKAETERIWLFFAPFVCLAAAAGPASSARLRPLLALLAVQAVA